MVLKVFVNNLYKGLIQVKNSISIFNNVKVYEFIKIQYAINSVTNIYRMLSLMTKNWFSLLILYSAIVVTICQNSLKCKFGQYLTQQNNCVQCLSTCPKCLDLINSCPSCSQGFVYISNNKSCNACKIGQKSCQNPNNIECLPHYYLLNNSCKPICKVNNCINCDSIYSNNCRECKQGYRLLNNICIQSRNLQQQTNEPFSSTTNMGNTTSPMSSMASMSIQDIAKMVSQIANVTLDLSVGNTTLNPVLNLSTNANDLMNNALNKIQVSTDNMSSSMVTNSNNTQPNVSIPSNLSTISQSLNNSAIGNLITIGTMTDFNSIPSIQTISPLLQNVSVNGNSTPTSNTSSMGVQDFNNTNNVSNNLPNSFQSFSTTSFPSFNTDSANSQNQTLSNSTSSTNSSVIPIVNNTTSSDNQNSVPNTLNSNSSAGSDSIIIQNSSNQSSVVVTNNNLTGNNSSLRQPDLILPDNSQNLTTTDIAINSNTPNVIVFDPITPPINIIPSTTTTTNITNNTANIITNVNCQVGSFASEILCVPCSSQCRTCINSAQQCLQCSIGWVKHGWKCISNQTLQFSFKLQSPSQYQQIQSNTASSNLLSNHIQALKKDLLQNILPKNYSNLSYSAVTLDSLALDSDNKTISLNGSIDRMMNGLSLINLKKYVQDKFKIVKTIGPFAIKSKMLSTLVSSTEPGINQISNNTNTEVPKNNNSVNLAAILIPSIVSGLCLICLLLLLICWFCKFCCFKKSDQYEQNKKTINQYQNEGQVYSDRRFMSNQQQTGFFPGGGSTQMVKMQSFKHEQMSPPSSNVALYGDHKLKADQQHNIIQYQVQQYSDQGKDTNKKKKAYDSVQIGDEVVDYANDAQYQIGNKYKQ